MDRSRDRLDRVLARLGGRVRSARRARDATVAELAAAAGLSRRFLTDVELGKANLSLQGLVGIAGALGLPPAVLLMEDGDGADARRGRLLERVRRLPESALERAAAQLDALASAPLEARRFALIGLRGAGKTAIGRQVAQRAKLRFVELDQQIEQAAGMPLADLFTLHGESHYRQLERDVLLRLTRDKGARPLLLATGGGIVAAPETFELLRRHFVTIWLKATPEDHWSRVVEQGDARPMQGQPAAMARMRQILADRAPLYRLAHHVVDTSALGLAESTARVRGLIEGRVAPPAPAAP